MKKTAKYYNSNPEAKAKKNAYQRKYNKKKGSVDKRVALNRENRRRGTYGNGDNLDYDHAVKSFVKATINRGRNSKNSGTKGDKKARG